MTGLQRVEDRRTFAPICGLWAEK